MSALKDFSVHQGLEFIGQNLDELSACLGQLGICPECSGAGSAGLYSGGWNARFAGAVADMRANIEALERAVTEENGKRAAVEKQ